MGRFQDEFQKQLGLTDEQAAEAKANGEEARESIERTGEWVQSAGCTLTVIGLIALVVFIML